MIPFELREQMRVIPFYKKCVLCNDKKVEWHHCWIYARKQVNELYAILPGCELHHTKPLRKIVDRLFKWVSINKMDLNYMQNKYPKFKWFEEQIRLNQEFGKYTPARINRLG